MTPRIRRRRASGDELDVESVAKWGQGSEAKNRGELSYRPAVGWRRHARGCRRLAVGRCAIIAGREGAFPERRARDRARPPTQCVRPRARTHDLRRKPWGCVPDLRVDSRRPSRGCALPRGSILEPEPQDSGAKTTPPDGASAVASGRGPVAHRTAGVQGPEVRRGA